MEDKGEKQEKEGKWPKKLMAYVASFMVLVLTSIFTPISKDLVKEAIAPFVPTKATEQNVGKGTPLADSASAPQAVIRTSFQVLKPRRVPTEAEVKQALEMIANQYGTRSPEAVGDPLVVSLSAPEAEQLVLAYEVTEGNAYTSGLEVVDLSAAPIQSIYHREGGDFAYRALSAVDQDKTKSYLLVEERTGVAGSYLQLSFLEYEGIGKLKEFYALQDLHQAVVYPLSEKLVLEREHVYYEIAKEKTLVHLVEYDMKGRLGFHVVTYGIQNGAWYARHNQEAVPSAQKGLALAQGEELFLVSDPQSEPRSVRTLIDGPALEYVKGPPVHILATKAGEGTIRFLSDAGDLPEFTVPIRVAAKGQ